MLGRTVLLNPRSSFHASDLHVVIPYSNHLRYQSRYQLMLKTVEHFLQLGVTLYVVELAHGSRQHILRLPPEVHHIKVRTEDVMWHKENQLDIGFRAAIENGAKYLQWADGDIHFSNPYIATEIIEALQNYPVLQPWKYAVDLDHDGNIIKDENGNIQTESFCSVWRQQIYDNFIPKKTPIEGNYSSTIPNKFGHFGYTWCMTSKAYLEIGGMLDWIITGAADYFMSLGYAGILDKIVDRMDEGVTPGYRRRLLEFHENCEKFIRGKIGLVPGTVLHGWHGPKAKRGYMTRPAILRVSRFDPDLDLEMTTSGLYRFKRENRLLRDGLDNYFYTRQEDQLA